MARASVRRTRSVVTTTTKTKARKGSGNNTKTGNRKRCSSCGRYLQMDKKNAETRRKLKEVETIAEFENILNQVMLSEEERQMLNLIYKDKQTISFVACELGMSESNVKAKHKKLLNKIGKLFSQGAFLHPIFIALL